LIARLKCIYIQSIHEHFTPRNEQFIHYGHNIFYPEELMICDLYGHVSLGIILIPKLCITCIERCSS